jgi:hypothetical protein
MHVMLGLSIHLAQPNCSAVDTIVWHNYQRSSESILMKWNLPRHLEEFTIWIDSRSGRKRIYRFAMLSLAWFFISWSLSECWLLMRLALRTFPEHAMWQVPRFVLITSIASFLVEMAHIFDGRDDDRDRGGPPELAPWPQSPDGDLRPEVLILDCVLDGRRTKEDAREFTMFPVDS